MDFASMNWNEYSIYSCSAQTYAHIMANKTKLMPDTIAVHSVTMEFIVEKELAHWHKSVVQSFITQAHTHTHMPTMSIYLIVRNVVVGPICCCGTTFVCIVESHSSFICRRYTRRRQRQRRPENFKSIFVGTHTCNHTHTDTNYH